MKLAVIDCGTNTFNLVIIDLPENKKYSQVYSARIPVKLGEGTINEGMIGEQAMKRAMDAFESFHESILEYGAEKVEAYATSAIRDARNGRQLAKQVKEKFHIPITVIDGEREAELIFLGIREAVELRPEVSLIMDIGGGSTEFILANKEKVFWKGSFRIGAARLLERFSPSDPITPGEIEQINTHLENELSLLKKAVKRHPPAELIGSSGAFESVLEIIEKEFGGEPFASNKTEYAISIPDYRRVSDLIMQSTLGRRKKIKGLVPMRQDMIVIFCLKVNYILHTFGLEKIRVSTYSLKEGAVIDFINNR